jgi:hypothetical protein
MFALKTLANLCTTQSSKNRSLYFQLKFIYFIVIVLQQSIRTAKVFKPNLLIPKHRNIKVKDGQWVEKDTVLTLQSNLVLYPGENVRQKTFVFSKFFPIFLFPRHQLRMIIQSDPKSPVLL